MDSKPSYYAIIPANVRYDENLPDGAKLLYGEITSLCNEKGYCWATNEYFGQLYGKTPRTIRNWISKLVSLGYIQADTQTKIGKQRLISIITISFSTPRKKISSPEEKNFLPNPIYNNKFNKAHSAFKKEPTYKFGNTEYKMRKKQNEWWCIPPDNGPWLKFAGSEKDIVYK